MSARRAGWAIACGVLFLAAFGARVDALGAQEGASGGPGKIQIVAAENFYGDIASQIGGAHVAVTSILSNPNIDPHEYESTVKDAIAVANSRIAIENGGGYDSWMGKLISASPNPKRIVLDAFDLAVTRLPNNVHVWYDVNNADAVARALRDALRKLDPAHSADYDRNYTAFQASLERVRQKIAAIRAKYSGTPIGLSETIFLYQSGELGLKVLTPLDFMMAIAEGNDPPASAAVTAERQISRKLVKALVYNSQTVDPITRKLVTDAKGEGIPIVAVTETMPGGDHYQSWMLAQLDRLEQALGG